MISREVRKDEVQLDYTEGMQSGVSLDIVFCDLKRLYYTIIQIGTE